VGSPAIQSATLTLENGKTFSIEAKNQSDKTVYVQKMVLNGKTLDRLYLTHAEITQGGQLTFFMGAKPVKK
jgi:putative alpha-1,2-mannosidase